MDQRICIKFCVKNGIKCSKTLEMLTVAYGESALSKKNVYKWCKLFQDGREDANDEPRSGRPSTSTTDENVKAVKKIVLENRRITIREVAEDVGISVGSCHEVFSDILGMRRVSAKIVPKLLNFDQKNRRMSIALELLNDVNDDPDLLKRVITGDESWVYGYDIETKVQSSQWKSPGEPRGDKNCIAEGSRLYQKVLIRSVLKIGKSVGTSVLHPRGITLKGTI
ncbi:protein GVQW3-like [Daktulosphaira vitifoliae]|uniref:protein GVQW3-like n=1 Tax=Daktulosphaira vitifoliae TaxID=58002 RepID=UPI0021AA3112|nr:protein GVQW3-like [Daktulosphaira vitifoliae]